jgi:hypothetical protein
MSSIDDGSIVADHASGENRRTRIPCPPGCPGARCRNTSRPHWAVLNRQGAILRADVPTPGSACPRSLSDLLGASTAERLLGLVPDHDGRAAAGVRSRARAFARSAECTCVIDLATFSPSQRDRVFLEWRVGTRRVDPAAAPPAPDRVTIPLSVPAFEHGLRAPLAGARMALELHDLMSSDDDSARSTEQTQALLDLAVRRLEGVLLLAGDTRPAADLRSELPTAASITRGLESICHAGAHVGPEEVVLDPGPEPEQCAEWATLLRAVDHLLIRIVESSSCRVGRARFASEPVSAERAWIHATIEFFEIDARQRLQELRSMHRVYRGSDLDRAVADRILGSARGDWGLRLGHDDSLELVVRVPASRRAVVPDDRSDGVRPPLHHANVRAETEDLCVQLAHTLGRRPVRAEPASVGAVPVDGPLLIDAALADAIAVDDLLGTVRGPVIVIDPYDADVGRRGAAAPVRLRRPVTARRLARVLDSCAHSQKGS